MFLITVLKVDDDTLLLYLGNLEPLAREWSDQIRLFREIVELIKERVPNIGEHYTGERWSDIKTVRETSGSIVARVDAGGGTHSVSRLSISLF